MKNDSTVQTYDKIAGHYNKSHFDPIFWMEEFEIFVSLVNGRKVIDIGCGAGRDAILFTRNKFDYTGIDASRNMLEIAESRVKRGRFIYMNFYDIKFPKGSFDCFWGAASLLHVPKKKLDKILRSIRKIIKDGGVGFISIKEKTEFDEGIIKENKFGGIERYFAFYTKKEFQTILEQNGFEILRSHVKIENEGTRWLCFFVKMH